MFDPSSLSGKILWLRAKDLGADGSSVDTWPDQSGNAKDALRMQNAPTVAANSTPLGGKSVRFNGSSGLYFAKFQGTRISAATASTYFSNSPGYPPANAIDGFPEMGGYTSVWASTTLPAWLRLQPTSATVATSYGTTVRIGPSVNQAPKDWTFEGSNDGTSWTVLDTRTGETPAAGESRVYSFSNSTAYTYYRINITAANGSTLTSLADFALNPVAGYGSIDNPMTGALSAAEIWVVAKADTGGSRGLWSWGGETSGGIDSGYPHSDNRVYESFGLASGNRQNFLPTTPPSAWQIYRVRNDGTTWEAWMSGATQLTAASKPFGYNSMQLIGRTKISSELSNFFTGNIAEIYMRGQISTSEESIQLHDYFAREHFSAVTSRHLYGTYTEAASTSSSPPRATYGAYAEALASVAQPPQLLYGAYVEILTPSAIEKQFTGWGTPL